MAGNADFSARARASQERDKRLNKSVGRPETKKEKRQES